MPFDRHLIEAELALQRIDAKHMPALAWDALEAGFDGPATRRLAALIAPSAKEIEKFLPRAMAEWQLDALDRNEAVLRLAKSRARQVLEGDGDPLKEIMYFHSLWKESGYCRELDELAGIVNEFPLLEDYDDPYFDEIRATVRTELQRLVNR